MSIIEMKFLEPFAGRAYALLRIVAGAMFMMHGLQKIFGVLAEQTPPVGSQMWVGGVLELVCGTAIALGLFARPAAFLVSGMMAVAYVQFHWTFRFDAGFFPIVNHGELALLYSFLFLLVATMGAGTWSLDAARRR